MDLLDSPIVFPVLIAAFYLVGYLHEAAHLFSALILRFKVRQITLGGGRRDVIRFKVGGIQVKVRPFPWGGSVVLKRFPEKGLRWKGALVVLAGPIVDAAILAFLLTQVPWEIVLEMDELQHQLLLALTLFQAANLSSNIFLPRPMGPDCDGRQFWSYVTGTINPLEAVKKYQENLARYDPSFNVHEDSVLITETRAAAALHETSTLIQNGEFEEVVSVIEYLLDTYELPVAERALLLDMIATLPVEQGYKAGLPKAIECAQQARLLLPESKSLVATQGALLVESESYLDGIALLETVTSPETHALDRGISACLLGKAYHRLGDREKSVAWFKVAVAAGTCDDLCRRIRLELATEELNSSQK